MAFRSRRLDSSPQARQEILLDRSSQQLRQSAEKRRVVMVSPRKVMFAEETTRSYMEPQRPYSIMADGHNLTCGLTPSTDLAGIVYSVHHLVKLRFALVVRAGRWNVGQHVVA